MCCVRPVRFGPAFISPSKLAFFRSLLKGAAMKRWLVVFATLLVASGPAAAKIDGDCALNGVKLHGKVQIVDSFPDIKVQIVASFPDLKVKPVKSFPDSCGQWQFVESFPDFKIQYVESFPDLKIEMVESFPGLP